MARKKIIVTGDKAREKLFKGVAFLADPVRSTLGPFGQNFLIEKENKVTNDGATVAREIEHKDEVMQRGITVAREATMKTNDEVGDATTTATILTHDILKEASRYVKSSKTIIGKLTPAGLIQKLGKEKDEVVEKLNAMAVPVDTEEKLIESAKVSVEDENLATLIGQAQFKLGPDGIIVTEETMEVASSIHYTQGIKIDNGFGSSYVVTDPQNDALDIGDCRIILTNHTLMSLAPLKAVLEQLAKMGVRKVIIIARAFAEQAIKDASENTKAGFAICPINAPYVDQREVMKDIAAVVGARHIDQEEGNLEDVQLSDVGTVSRLIAKRSSAEIVGVDNDMTKKKIAERKAELEARLSGVLSPFEQRHIRTRLAQLQNGLAVLKVGAPSVIERKRLKDKADDAVQAVRWAYQEGVVPGAGMVFKTIAETLPDDYILKTPLQGIYNQIMSSAPEGFEVPEWVKDPVKVLRVALENAVSVAGTLATAAGVSAYENEKPMFVRQQEEIEVDDDEA